MNYIEKQIKEGIQMHFIQNDKFKTNLIAIFLTTKLNRDTVTKNALIPAVLRRGTQRLQIQEDISKELQGLYGTSFDCGVDKTGDNQVLKFYMEPVNDLFLPQNTENVLEKAIQNLLEIVLNPYLENGIFKQEYVEQEKVNMQQIIEGKINNKARFAMDRCIEEMYKDEPFGLYKYGYIEDLNNIDAKSLYEAYMQLLNNCKIDIFVSGNISEDIENFLVKNEHVQKLNPRTPNYQMPENHTREIKEEKVVQESMEVTQGKLVLSLQVPVQSEQEKYDAMIYNNILGGSANSKLFRNVREKASLAYTASSSYMRFKSNIFINCGIEIQNYEKALEIIKKQIEDMKNGDFTDEELENAKYGIVAAIKTIDDEQDTEVTYFFGQELSGSKKTLEEYQKAVQEVTRDGVLKIANQVKVDTIYFLKN